MNVPSTVDLRKAWKDYFHAKQPNLYMDEAIIDDLFDTWLYREEMRIREEVAKEIDNAVPDVTDRAADDVKSALEISLKEAVRQGMLLATRIVRRRNARVTSN